MKTLQRSSRQYRLGESARKDAKARQACSEEDFSMLRLIALALLVTGAVLVVYGIGASQSLASDFSRFFHGTPTDKSIWLMIGGGVLGVVGVAGLLSRSKSHA